MKDDWFGMFVVFAFWFVLGLAVGSMVADPKTTGDIDPEMCVSVCASEFEKYGC